MALLEYTIDGKVDKVEQAIKRIQLGALSPEPLYVCYSGGKDSKVLRRLMEMSGVAHELHYNLTTVDIPSVVREILDDKEVTVDKARYPDGKQKTMWNLIVKKKMPPTRLCRYCCAELKEGGGKGRICITGVRKSESVNRKLNGGEVKIINGIKAQKTMIENKIEGDFDLTPKGGLVMNLDNNENRRLVEQCYRTNKTIINPIIDWTDEDIWGFSKVENIQQSGLYKQCGGRYNRLGCIGCPMASLEEKLLEFAEYPKIKQAYINAFDRMVKNYGAVKSTKYDWYDGQAVFDWWLYGDKNTTDDNQLSIDDIE